MTSKTITLKEGPARDILISIGGKEVFATAQVSYLIQSPQTLADEDSAVVLDPSYWWFDQGREPESLRIERKSSRVEFVGKKRVEQTHGDSTVVIGECDFSDWTAVVQKISSRPNNA
jgi:hypothetical protein